MRVLLLLPGIVLLTTAVIEAVEVPASPTAAEAPAQGPPEPAGSDGAASAWSFDVSLFTYLVPDSREYVQPTVAVDRDWLHLEARYNYEDLDTGSAWVGYNFRGGETLAYTLTPMLGGVFGNTAGIAPGYKASLAWWRLELTTEGECVFDARDLSDSFFYTWSELTLAPCDWFYFGGVVQRTKLYQTAFDTQRGFLIGLALDDVALTTYVFNPDDDPTIVVAVSVSF